MAIYSGMFNSVNGDRKYNAWWFALFFSRFIGDGVFPNPSTGLQVIENGNMTVTVKPGDGWIKGHFIHSDGDYVLQHDLADGVLKRIDRIVMRLNYTTRQIELDIKKGVFASNPVAPILQRDADMHELALADVLIYNGATIITQAHITDNRLNKSLCGIVHGTVDQVDTTTLFNQYQSWFNEYSQTNAQAWQDWQSRQSDGFNAWQAQERQNFEDWFASIQGVLDGDVAGNLLSIIEDHEADTTVHIQPGERDSWNTKTTVAEAQLLVDNQFYKVTRSGKDINGIFTVVEHFRVDGKRSMRSVLSLGTSPHYTRRTVTLYAENGTTIKSTRTLTLTYDADGDLLREV